MLLYSENLEAIKFSQDKDALLNHLSAKIFSFLGKGQNRKLLDLGCGSGRNALIAAQRGFKVIGIDPEAKAIRLAQAAAESQGLRQCRFVVGDPTKSSTVGEESVEVVVCSEVIEHVGNPKAIIDYGFRVLKKGGVIALTAPHDAKQWTILDDYAEHKRRFSINEIKFLLADFEIIELYTVGFPLTRVFFWLYHRGLRQIKFDHQATKSKSRLTMRLYWQFLAFVLKIDEAFNSLNRGTNIVVFALKR